jgi:hypothetical protein
MERKGGVNGRGRALGLLKESLAQRHGQPLKAHDDELFVALWSFVMVLA